MLNKLEQSDDKFKVLFEYVLRHDGKYEDGPLSIRTDRGSYGNRFLDILAENKRIGSVTVIRPDFEPLIPAVNAMLDRAVQRAYEWQQRQFQLKQEEASAVRKYNASLVARVLAKLK